MFALTSVQKSAVSTSEYRFVVRSIKVSCAEAQNLDTYQSLSLGHDEPILWVNCAPAITYLHFSRLPQLLLTDRITSGT
jgi:hypothetical protein